MSPNEFIKVNSHRFVEFVYSYRKKIILFSLFFIVLIFIPKDYARELSAINIFLFIVIGVYACISIMCSYLKFAFSLNLMHWIFVLLFFCFAPLVQYQLNYNPWGFVFTNDNILSINLVVLLWCAIYSFFYYMGRCSAKRKTQKVVCLISYDRLKVLTIISVLIAVFVLVITKGDVLTRGDYSDALSGIVGSTLSSVIISVTRSLVAATFLMSYIFSFEKKKWKQLIIITSCMLLVNFPTAMARFNLATLYMPLVLFFSYKKGRKISKSLFIYIFFIGLFVVFPALSYLRYASIFEISILEVLSDVLSSISADLASGHYDAYSIIGGSLNYVADNGITYGHQLISAILFFVPRSLWSSKAYGTGYTIAHYYNYSFDNISAPLQAEAIINFGIFGIFLFALVFGIFFGRMDKSFWLNYNQKGLTLIKFIYPCLLAPLFFMMRGDLLSTMSTTVAFLVSAIVAYKYVTYNIS